MPKRSDVIGVYRIVNYPKEVYCLHYKGEPFSIGKLSYSEQREMGVPYPSEGAVMRKVYFTEGNAKIGIRNLPKELRDKVEIVKYVPEKQIQSEEDLKELPLFKKEGV